MADGRARAPLAADGRGRRRRERRTQEKAGNRDVEWERRVIDELRAGMDDEPDAPTEGGDEPTPPAAP
jgi:hypothetical protein